MKRMTLLLAAGIIAVVTARTIAIIPEQVKIDTGLLSLPARAATCNRAHLSQKP